MKAEGVVIHCLFMHLAPISVGSDGERVSVEGHKGCLCAKNGRGGGAAWSCDYGGGVVSSQIGGGGVTMLDLHWVVKRRGDPGGGAGGGGEGDHECSEYNELKITSKCCILPSPSPRPPG